MSLASIHAAPRAQAVAPFHVMRILEQARALEQAGRDVIHMEVGEPDFPTPEPVLEAARRALGDRPMRYTPAAGLPELREAIAGWYDRRYGLPIDPRRIIVTPGGSGGLQLALAALLDPGDGVLVTDPGYPCNRHIARIVGAEPVAVPVFSGDGYCPRAGLVESLWSDRVRALMVATPANPTGSVLSPAQLTEFHALATTRGGALIVDEIYQGLVYEAEDCTALACGQDGLFVINSFSKFFGMTGWRLGWIVAPPAFVDVLERLAQNLFLAPPTLSQYAALAALSPDTLPILEARRDTFRQRRDVLLDALRGVGMTVPAKPLGAFYAYVRTPAGFPDGAALAAELLDTAGVALTPGVDFGSHGTQLMLRLAYTVGPGKLREAVTRIADFLAMARDA